MSCTRCGNKVVENTDTMLCATCNKQERVSPPATKKQKRFNFKVSSKLKKKLSQYSKQRKAYLDNNPICVVCGHKASDVHHIKGRGIYLLVEEFWMAVCRLCHTKIETNTSWAISKGYKKSRLEQ